MKQAVTTNQVTYQTARRGGGKPTKVALIGAGTVGEEVVRLLRNRPEFELVGVLVRDAARERAFTGWQELVTTNEDVLAGVDVLVEVAGGTGKAADLSLRHLAAGKQLVTANKAALAERWAEYLPHAEEGRVHFEAAVMAGTPAVGVLAGALRGSAPVSLHAVLNGTCNVILAMMDEGSSFVAALAEAQRLGFAEADPTLDVGGFDAAHKLTVLGRLAFDPALTWQAVRGATRGISDLTEQALAAQAQRGRRVRLIGSIVANSGRWEARVRPVSLPVGHPLLTTGGTNALLFTGDPVGTVYVRGAGAGGGSTASGVLADMLTAAAGNSGPRPLASAAPVPLTASEASDGVEEL